jgi:homoserine dehydrogenase
MAEKVVRVGIVGFGTVGTGVAKIILEHADRIAAKTGLRLQLAHVVDIDTKSPRAVELPGGILTGDVNKLLQDDSVGIGVELIGGHGSELYQAAHANNRCIAFEASCCAGIPIISAIRTGLAANDITAMYGIVNGTCNYILSNMTSENQDFADALAEAQRKGYAEADPTLDISGGDSAHKLTILASIAFGCEIRLDDISVEGIEQISKDDIRYGGEMGYVLKLLAIAQKTHAGKISLGVHPSFVARQNRIARVDGPFNAASIFGNAVGNVMYYGRGAGMMPTASAVVADIIEVALGNSATIFRHLHLRPREETLPLIERIDNLVSRFYIRVMCKDQPGVIAQWSRILADHQISISGALQHEGHGPENTVPVVITTHPTIQRNVTAAVDDMEKLDSIGGKPICIRIVDIPEDAD